MFHQVFICEEPEVTAPSLLEVDTLSLKEEFSKEGIVKQCKEEEMPCINLVKNDLETKSEQPVPPILDQNIIMDVKHELKMNMKEEYQPVDLNFKLELPGDSTGAGREKHVDERTEQIFLDKYNINTAIKTSYEETHDKENDSKINVFNNNISISEAMEGTGTTGSLEYNKLEECLNNVNAPSCEKLEYIAKDEENKNISSKLLPTVNPSFIILNNSVGEYITPDEINLGGSQRLSHSVKEASPESNAISSPFNQSENDEKSGSDWEQEFLLEITSNKGFLSKSKNNKKNNKISPEQSKRLAATNPIDKINGSKQLRPLNEMISTLQNNEPLSLPVTASPTMKASNYIHSEKNVLDSNNMLMVNSSSNYKKNNIMFLDITKTKRTSSQIQATTETFCLYPVEKMNAVENPQTKNLKKTSKYKQILPKPQLISRQIEIKNANILEGLKQLSETLFLCHICQKFFQSRTSLSYHMNYSLCTGYKRKLVHQCDICGKLFSGLEKLENHKNSHTNTRPHKCSNCNKWFNSKGARQMHYKKMHEHIKIRHLCCYCGITTPVKSHLLAHEETHRLPEGAEIPTPFKCLQCGKGYISGFQLMRHKREHKLKKCPKCSEEFFTVTLLQKHLEAAHKIVELHECKICKKTFKRRESLRTHSKTHSNVLSFFCDICDKGFKQKHHIEQHMITHSDERPISCPECSETFKRKTHLKQHVTAFHGKGKKR